MKVLFIGGTGNISSACSRLASSRDIDLVHLNRGERDPAFPGVRTIRADIRDEASARQALQGEEFDCVVDWIAFTPEHIRTDLRLFRERTKQFIFISSASAYQKPPTSPFVTESTPLENPFWEYSRNKILCEKLLTEEGSRNGFPATIVRPSYTYGERLLPFAVGGGYTLLDRMRKGKKIPLHGDGSSLWVMTHNSDFAKGFLGLLANPSAIGEAYHITSDEVLNWNQITQAIAEAAGTEAQIVHRTSEEIARIDPAIGAGLLGDKTWSLLFDNTKIRQAVPGFRATVPFREGIRETVAWFLADPLRQATDPALDALMDRLTETP